jgi:LPXTG-motif cell wall-anchored protein
VRRRWLTRTTLALVLGVVIWVLLSLSQEAAADDDPTATGGTAAAGVTAAQVNTDCDHGGPYRAQDVWVFSGPGTATLEAATFADGTGQVEVRTATEKAFDLAGHSVVWLSAPAGWSLAEVKPAEFKVVGACPAATQQRAAAQQNVGAQHSASAQQNVGAQQNAAAQQNVQTGEASGADAAPAQLPQTGQDVTAMVAVGSALVISGVLLLFVRRQRPSPRPPARDEGDRVWTYPTYSG